MRIGLDIGFEKVSVSVFGQGVPRVLTDFPSVAAHKNDFSECFFGMEARSYQDEEDFTYISSLRRHIFSCTQTEDPSFSLLLEKLFAYVVKVISRNGVTEVEGITMVLPQPAIQSKTLQDAVVSAWQKNNVDEVLLISDITAIILSYTALSLDRKTLFKADGETAYLVVCNAGYEYFHMDIFEVIHNNYVGKFDSHANISWNWDSMQQIRKKLHKLVSAKLKDSGVSKLPSHIIEQLKEEIDRQMTGFDEPKIDKITIRMPNKTSLTVNITRDDYNAAIKPVINQIQELVFASAALINAGMVSTGESRAAGNVEVLLVGKNSRLLPLRDVLETIQKPLNSRVLSYADDAESFGAAVASCLMEPSTSVNKAQMASRLRQGVLFDMQTILRALLLADTQDAPSPTDVEHAQAPSPMETDKTSLRPEMKGESLLQEMTRGTFPMGTEQTQLPAETKEETVPTDTKEAPSPTQANQILAPTAEQQRVLETDKGQMVANTPATTVVRINELQSIVVSGTLCFGYPAGPLYDTEFQLVLLTKTTTNRTFHYIQLEMENNGERMAFMRVLLGKRTRLGLDRTPSGTRYLRILTIFNGPTKPGWNELAFFLSEKYKHDVYDRFMVEYGVRFDEMLTAFPEMSTDNFWLTTQHGKSMAFIGLMPEMPNNKSAAPDRQKHRLMPSIITLCETMRHRIALNVQQCQEVLESGQVQEREHCINDIVNCRQQDYYTDKAQLQHPYCTRSLKWHAE